MASSPPGHLLSVTTLTPTFHLRSALLTDAPGLLSRTTNPACTKFIPGLRHATPTLASIESLIRAWRADSCLTSLFFILLLPRKDGEADEDEAQIGDGGFESLDVMGPVRSGEVGVMLNADDDPTCPGVRGKGYAILALKIFLELGFTVLDLDIVRLRTLEANEAMVGLTKRKFGLEGEVAEVEVSDGGGGTELERCFTFTKSEWRKRQDWRCDLTLVVKDGV